MRFELTSDQQDFATSLESLLSSAGTVGVARAWADGDHGPGLKLWARLAEQGVTMLATEASPVEICISFEALGRHAVPGPWVESAAYLPVALGRELDGVGTVSVPPGAEGLDADVADEAYIALNGALYRAVHHGPARSVDRTRHLFESSPTEAIEHVDLEGAWEIAALATSAQLLGLGERVLSDTVAYAKQRRQFGREIGSYQAIKHQLADVRIALDFARPLVHGAALDLTPRAVSAAKVMTGDAAYLAARTGLQVHGAVGYTRELDLSLWITKIRALVTAWGTPAHHRARILASLLEER